MKYDLNILNKYIDEGLVIKQVHPTLPLSIYNYSRECQYDGKWDDITLNCRGLVLDDKGNVIAKPFPKFFNYEEIKPEDIPNENFEVYEKMDGSLGILFYYERELSYEERYKKWYINNFESGFEYNELVIPNFDEPYYEPTPTTKGEWHIATRGSFQSDQAIKAKQILDTKYNVSSLRKTRTYLFEIIYPENRIVVDYGNDEKLVLLAVIDTESGEEIPNSALYFMVEDGWDVVTTYKTWGEDWDTLKREISKDNEGYVIRFTGGMRMKIKGVEYVRLHKILTNFSTKDIWELLKNNEPLEPFLERVPDEFDKWVKAIIMNLRYSFHHIDERAGKLHDGFRYGKFNDRDPEPTKKEFAEYVKQFPKELAAVMFKMWDKQPYDNIIWSMIKPKYEKPFKNNNDI
jgi:RNA ligase